jgi:DNA repair exonuclease SbcCD ATPase subunit
MLLFACSRSDDKVRTEGVFSMGMRFPIAFAFLLTLPAYVAAQSDKPPVTEAEKKHQELITQQSLERLKSAADSLDEAIAGLKAAPKQQAAAQAEPPAGTTQFLADNPAQHAVVQQAEQALHDVRRAIDEIGVPEDKRQRVLDRLDDADSAMRMARQPDAAKERQRLAVALQAVQQEVQSAQEALPAAPVRAR